MTLRGTLAYAASRRRLARCQTGASMPSLVSASNYVRTVSGEIVSSMTASTSVGRIEFCNRRQEAQIEWQFCQPEMTLFWHREGFREMRGNVDGVRVSCDFAGGSN